VRRVVAWRRVGRHLHQGLQETNFFFEVRVDPGVELAVWRGGRCQLSFVGQVLDELHEGRDNTAPHRRR
jgi:hypothetical protein